MENNENKIPEKDQERTLVLLSLSPALVEFLDELCSVASVGYDQVIGCLLDSSMYRYLIGCKIDSLGLDDDVQIPGINPFLPIIREDLERACAYLDSLVVPKEVLEDAE